MWFSYQYWGCTQLEKSCWWIRGESVVFSRSQQKEGKWSPLFLLLKARWTRWFPWTFDLLINKSKQCWGKQKLWQKQSIGKETITGEGGENTFWRITAAQSQDHLMNGHCLVGCKCVGYSKLYALTEGTTKYSKYYLGQVCKEEYVIIQTCTEWLCARRKTDFCKNTSWTTGDGQQPQHASFRTTSGRGN